MNAISDWRAALGALDRPARAAVDLSRLPLLRTAAPALVGLALLAASALLAEGLAAGGPGMKLDLMGRALEALAGVAPSWLVFAVYLRLRVAPRVLVAGLALGLLTAGVVAACLAPLSIFIALVSAAVPEVRVGPVLVLPVVLLGATGSVLTRVVDATDGSRRGFLLGRAFTVALFAAFLLRIPDYLLAPGRLLP